MNASYIRYLGAVAAALVVGLAPGAIAQTMDHSQHGASAPAGASSSSMKGAMPGMTDMQSMKMTGDGDHDFAMMMKKHHEDGIKMAQAELENGKDPKMREMAQKIIDAQRKEIREFDQWMKNKMK